jgi:hypothetical protein
MEYVVHCPKRPLAQVNGVLESLAPAIKMLGDSHTLEELDIVAGQRSIATVRGDNSVLRENEFPTLSKVHN